jgi:hypothetical protein
MPTGTSNFRLAFGSLIYYYNSSVKMLNKQVLPSVSTLFVIKIVMRYYLRASHLQIRLSCFLHR